MDPMTMTAATMGMQAVGAGVKAYGTLLGGSYARQGGLMKQQADNYEAAQLDINAQQARAAAQRQALDTGLNTQYALSSLQARAAASGGGAADPTVINLGSTIAGRGEYQALGDMYKGENQARGLEDQAAGLRYSGTAAAIGGNEQATGAGFSAADTLLGGATGMFQTYGQNRLRLGWLAGPGGGGF